ncbi:MAG: Cell surface protein [Ignavibacteriae bacterium]|nr:MAG: Cell surface protein [Ignavibacteriota bacterium]
MKKLVIACLFFTYILSAQERYESVSQNSKVNHKLNKTKQASLVKNHSNQNSFKQISGDEFLIDKSPQVFPAPRDQKNASAAFDGENYFVVWEDIRNGNYDIYGARVTKEGILLDTSGIVIAKSSSYKISEADPKIAFDGNNFLVVWNRRIERYPSDDYDIIAARISRNGILLDSSGIVIRTGPDIQYNPSVAFDGTNYFVVWEEGKQLSPYYQIHAARITPEGTVIDTQSIPLTSGDFAHFNPCIAFDGSNYLVVWNDGRHGVDIYGVRVSTSGIVIDTNEIPICTNFPSEEFNPEISFNGTNYLVVWETGWPDYDIYGTRVSTSGVVLDTNGIMICSAIGSQWKPSVTNDGDNFFIAWNDGRTDNLDIYGARLSAGGILIDTNALPLRTNSLVDERNPSIVFGDTSYLLLWDHSTPPDYYEDVYGIRVSRNGSVLDVDNFCISSIKAVIESWEPAVTFGDTNFLVVFEQYQDNNPIGIKGVRVSLDGVILDSSLINIYSSDASYPSVASNDTNYLVVFEDWSEGEANIKGAILDKNGSVYDVWDICYVNGWQQRPAVIFGDTNYFVVWHDTRGLSSDIYGARVDQNGNVLDYNGIPIYNESGSDKNPALSFDGTNYMVVWEHKGDIYGCRVSQNAEVLDPDGFIISSATSNQVKPAIAFDGNNYLVVWQDNRNNENDIYAARVTPDGLVLDTNGIAICTAINSQENPSIIFDGKNYIITWEDYRDNQTISNIYGACVSTDGTILEEVPIIKKDSSTFSPALARGYGDKILLVYDSWTEVHNNIEYNAYRVWGKFDPLVVEVKEISTQTPTTYNLYQNYPNPFNPITKIQFSIPKTSYVTLKVYNTIGQEVIMLVNEEKSPGTYEVALDASNLPSGVYFYRLKADNFVDTKKLLLIR